VESDDIELPAITVPNDQNFVIGQGSAFSAKYTLTGTEPVTVTVETKDERNVDVPGFVIDMSAKTINAPNGLADGMYLVTVTAENSAGKHFDSFVLYVTVIAEPPVVIVPKDQNFSVMNSADFQVLYTLTGTDPIDVTVEAKNELDVIIPGFIIDMQTKTITAPIRLADGNYTITVTAENNAGRSSDTFVLTIEAAELVAPQINNKKYINQMTQDTDYTAQFFATGSEPLIWSIEPISPRMPVPDEISIDNNGLLTIKGSISTGNQSFIVKVSNSVGYDTLEMTIAVKAAFRSVIPREMERQFSFLPNGTKSSSIMFLSAGLDKFESAGLKEIEISSVDKWQIIEEIETKQSFAQRAAAHAKEIEWQDTLKSAILPDAMDNILKSAPPPLNKVTVRWNDARDIYTNDRDTVNGTKYVFWGSAVKLDISDSESTQFYQYTHEFNDFQYAPTGVYLINPIFADGIYYHNYVNSPDEYETQEEESPPKYQPIEFSPDLFMTWGLYKADIISRLESDDHYIGDLVKDLIKDGVSNPRTGNIIGKQYLDLGLQLEAINSNGPAILGLDETTGTSLPGAIFSALADKPKSSLSIEQPGAIVTFFGKDISNNISGVYDFGYSSGTYLAENIFETAKMTGGENFVYSFKYHGELPGMATFDIMTNLAEGSKVNIYRYDAETNSFTHIAQNVKVDANGNVSYRNNTMSHYLITTNTIDGVLTTKTTVEWRLLITIAAMVILIVICIVVIVILKKKKQTVVSQTV